MQDCENVPVVSYRLWGLTARLPEKHLSKDKTYALLNEDGKPLQRKWIDGDGKPQKVCNISVAYRRMAGRLRLKHSLDQLKKTSVDLLFNHKQYKPLHALFLGHAPRSVAERFARLPGAPVQKSTGFPAARGA